MFSNFTTANFSALSNEKIKIEDLTDEITSLMLSSMNVADEDQRAGAFRSNIVSLYTNVLAKRIPEIAEEEARRAWMYGKYITG